MTYTIDGFLDKNKDTLFNSLKAMLENSKNPFIQNLFPHENISGNIFLKIIFMKNIIR